jgi:hypothetical protein
MEQKDIKCECGRDKHYYDAIYCALWGKKLKEAAVTTSFN